MKKYLFGIIALLALPATIFAVVPSFEIYEGGGVPWPSVTDVYVSPIIDNSVTITAKVFDAAGVYSSVAIIRNPAGVEVSRSVMQDDGLHQDGNEKDNVYGAFVNVSYFEIGNYAVDIFVSDYLGNSATYNDVGVIKILPRPTEISLSADSYTAVAGWRINLSAILTYSSDADPLTNQTIVFTDETDSVEIGSAVTNSLGAVSVSYLIPASATQGTHTITASYGGNRNSETSSDSISLNILAETEINSFSAAPLSGLPGTEFTLSAKLVDAGGAAIEGEVIIFLDETASASIGSVVTSSFGIATIYYSTPDDISVGEHSLAAKFEGNDNFFSSHSTATLTISEPPSVIQTEINPFIASPSPASAGGLTTLSATLINAENELPISGKFIMFFNVTEQVSIGTALTNASGIATFEYTAPASAGNYIISAVHYADEDTNMSYTALGLRVLISTEIIFDANPSIVGIGSPTLLSATLQHADGTPLSGGSIVFSNSVTGEQLAVVLTDASGVATYSYTVPSSLAAGSSIYLKASYAGDFTRFGSYALKTISVLDFTNITVSAIPNSATVRDVVALTATLTYSNGNAASLKAVDFYLDSITEGNLLATRGTNSSGVASYNYTILDSVSAGQHNIIAAYSGTSTLFGCSALAILTITGRGTVMTLTAAPDSLYPNQAMSITANLKYAGTGGTAIPGAVINFWEETSFPSVSLGTKTTNGSGYAGVTYIVPSTATDGVHTVRAVYEGYGLNLPVETTTTFTVLRTSTRISSYTPAAGTEIIAGNSVTVSGTLVYGTAGSALYNKALTFRDTTRGVDIGTAQTNASGYASLSYAVPSNATIGTHNISISFAGDSNYSACSASTNIKVVNTRISPFTVSPTTMNINGRVTLSAKLLTASGGALYPQTITFTDVTRNATIGTAQTNASGIATLTYTIPSSAIGNHVIKASFAGSGTYSACSATANLNVTAAPTCTFTNFSLFPSVATAAPITPFTFSARLMSSTGSAISGATVSFINAASGASLQTATTGSTGWASTNTSYYFTNTGTYTLRASFAGNSTYPSCTSSPITLTINAASVQPSIEGFQLTQINPNSPSSPILATLRLIDRHTGLPMAGQFIELTENTSGVYLTGGDTNSDGEVSRYVNFIGPGDVFCVTATYDGDYGTDSANSCIYIESTRRY